MKFAIVGAFQPSFVQGNGWDGWLQSTYRPQVALPTLVCRSNATWLEFPGEINTQNKNKGKINNCGFDPMRTEKRCWAVDVMAEVLTFHELCGRSTGRVIFQKPQLQDLPPATAVLAFLRFAVATRRWVRMIYQMMGLLAGYTLSNMWGDITIYINI